MTKAYQATEIQLAHSRSQLLYVISPGNRCARTEIWDNTLMLRLLKQRQASANLRPRTRTNLPYQLKAPCCKEDHVQNTQISALDGCFWSHHVWNHRHRSSYFPHCLFPCMTRHYHFLHQVVCYRQKKVLKGIVFSTKNSHTTYQESQSSIFSIGNQILLGERIDANNNLHITLGRKLAFSIINK